MDQASGRAFAATWRNEAGDVVGTTFGGTMCLWPRKPWRIKIARDGFEHVIRCGECPGCLEFDRRRLAGRLYAKYQRNGGVGAATSSTRRSVRPAGGADKNTALFVVRIWARIDDHAAISHRLHRRRGLELEPGMYRLGASSFALLSRERSSLPLVLREAGVKFRIEPVRLSRGRRAWRMLTAGLIVAREIYGEDRNRWYARGLPNLDREKWEVQKIAKYQSYDRSGSPRARTDRRVVLVPPEVWKLRRADRRSVRSLLLRQSDPEGVRKVMGMVADAIRSNGRALLVVAAPKALLREERMRENQAQKQDTEARRTALLNQIRSLPPTSEVGGYVSSEHGQGELMPEQLATAGRKSFHESRKRRAIAESMAIIERMRKKTEGW